MRPLALGCTAAVVALLVQGLPLPASPAGAEETAGIRAAIDAVLEPAHADGRFSGVALVARDDAVVYERAFGLAAREWNVPHKPESKFRIGSLTKQFTATLILGLVEDGRIDLDAPVERYLPEYPSPGRERITIRHLLSHTSGIPDVTRRPDVLEIVRDPATPAEVASRYCSDPSTSRPGSEFEYSNCGYLVLGLVYETVTGHAYVDGVERLAQRAGLTATGYAGPSEIVPRLAHAYRRTAEDFVHMPYVDWSVAFASGSLYSTAADLARWTRALGDGEILSPTSRAMMFSDQMNGYGVGWHVGTVTSETLDEFLSRDEGTTERRPGAFQIVSHGGDLPGFHSRVTYLPETGEVVVLLDNHDSGALASISADMVRVLVGRPLAAR